MLPWHSVDFRHLSSTSETPIVQSMTFTEQQAHCYQTFQSLIENSSHIEGVPVLRWLGEREWQLSGGVPLNQHKTLIHVIGHAPTLSLLGALITELRQLTKVADCYVHPCSDYQQGLIGLLFPIETTELEALRSGLVSIAQAFSVEIGLTVDAPELSKPGLLLMDMDSTVIAAECIDEIAVLAGAGEAVAEVTEQAMRGELDFAQSLRSRVACLEGLEQSALETVKRALPIMPGLHRLISRLHHHGWYVAIASGGFTYFADHLKARFGLDAAVANQLEIVDGKLTGKVLGDIVDANTKAETVAELAERWTLPKQQTIAMGDGANDLTMMAAAQLGIAFRAKPVVQEKADVAIRVAGLDTALFYLR